MGANDPRRVANLDCRGMIGRIYVGYHQTWLHTKYTGFRHCGFRKEDAFMFFLMETYGNYASGRGLFGPRGMVNLGRIYKGDDLTLL